MNDFINAQVTAFREYIRASRNYPDWKDRVASWRPVIKNSHSDHLPKFQNAVREELRIVLRDPTIREAMINKLSVDPETGIPSPATRTKR